jgi:hypothetical protein
MAKIGRPPRTDATSRTQQVGVSMTKVEAAAVKRLADQRDVRPAVLIRELALDAIARLDEDPAEAKPAPRAAAAETATLRAQVLDLGAKLAPIANNMNQLARAMNRAPVAVPDELAGQVRDLTALLKTVRQMIARRTF